MNMMTRMRSLSSAAGVCVLLVAACAWSLPASLGAEVMARARFPFEELRLMRRDRYVDVSSEPGAVSLTPFELVFDEVGHTETGQFNVALSDRVHAKKEFVIRKEGVRWAQLYVLQGSEDTRMDFNGVRLTVTGADKWAYGRWGVVDVPVECLKDGLNEVVFSGSGTLFVSNSVLPNRSAQSVDGGQTWDYDHIGNGGAFNGEYTVRLGLGRYPDRGTIWSDGIDMAALGAEGPIAPRATVRSFRLAAEVDAPEGTAVRFECRSGRTPAYDPEQWAAWRPAGPGQWLEAPAGHRYAQWRATLSTTDPGRTPRLESVDVQVRMETATPADAERITVAEFHNQKIVRSSYHFTYQAPSPRTEILRKLHRPDEVTAGAETELARFVALRDWTRHQWDNGWTRGELYWCTPPDALVILDMMKRGKGAAFCGHYAEVFIQCAQSLGYNARLIAGRAHAYAEVWSNQHRKWIIMDAGPAVDDEKELNYHYEHGGVPLSALEMHRRLLADDWEGVDVVTSDPANDWEPTEQKDAMRRYLYVRIQFRNNKLDSPLPGDLDEHGWPSDTDWIVWRDGAISELRRDYPYTTNREGDIYWTLNQVAMYPSYGEAAGNLRLEFDTHTPNFSTYQVRVDDGEWTDCGNSFNWPLQQGRNRLAARTVNAFGAPGIESSLEVDYAQ